MNSRYAYNERKRKTWTGSQAHTLRCRDEERRTIKKMRLSLGRAMLERWQVVMYHRNISPLATRFRKVRDWCMPHVEEASGANIFAVHWTQRARILYWQSFFISKVQMLEHSVNLIQLLASMKKHDACTCGGREWRDAMKFPSCE